MATFNELATELQIAIWQLVLPYRGIYWIELEGRPHDAPYVRDSIRFTRQSYGGVPEISRWEVSLLEKCKEHEARFMSKNVTKERCPSMFFQCLGPVVPSVWGAAGPGNEHGDREMTEQELAEELADTRRCRQLSTYTQVTALLATCRLSREIALEYIQKSCPYKWQIYRSKGPLYRPRPLHVWEEQYTNENSNGPDCNHRHIPLVPTIRSPLDLVVLRLHDSHGRPTPLLRQGGFQFQPESRHVNNGFPWFDRLAIEWHPRWADEKDQFRAVLVANITGLMHWSSKDSTMLYWLVDGIPRPNWKRDYPEIVPKAFNVWMRRWNWQVHQPQYDMDEATKARFLADCDLDLEFEANGRRYYVVFVVIRDKNSELHEAGIHNIELPLIGGEAIWPEKLRAPARFAYDTLNDDDLFSLWTHRQMSFILSWEPI